MIVHRIRLERGHQLFSPPRVTEIFLQALRSVASLQIRSCWLMHLYIYICESLRKQFWVLHSLQYSDDVLFVS